MDKFMADFKDKWPRFRIKELKDILTQLGLSKQGKKQDLLERILTVLSDDEVYKMSAKKNMLGKEDIVNIIKETYRKMQKTSTTDLANAGEDHMDNSLQLKEELIASFEPPLKIRCLCESSSTESLIKCDDLKCCIWQHMSCVIIPEGSTACDLDPPEVFYCEICRLRRADPFLSTLAHLLTPMKLDVENVPVDGSNPLLHLEKTFQLTWANRSMLSKENYDVQAWCMLVNDKVPFRMQWPQHADLHINGIPVRATNRPGSQMLGSNGRDDGPIITPCIREGTNKVSLTATDARTFCFGVRLIKRRSLQKIRNLVPKELDGESFDEALARVQRCIGGGVSTDDAESDDEVVVVAESHVISLRCPMSGSRIKVAGRFRPCVHLGGFDLDIFLEMNQRSRKWQCPICLKNYSLEYIIIDPYFNRITSMMQNCSDDIADIEVKPDGCWRVKTKNEVERGIVGDLAHWHSPDGSRCKLTEGDDSEKMGMLCKVKQECLSDKQVALQPKVIPLSITTSGSGRDEEGSSVNQDGYEVTEYINNGIECDSLSLNNDPSNQKNMTSYAPPSSAEVIVVSDSEGEEPVIVAEAVRESCNRTVFDFNVPCEVSASSPLHGPSSAIDCAALSTASGPAHATPDAAAVLSNNLLPYGGTNPSLQMYHHPMPSNDLMDYEVTDQMSLLNGNHSDDWISLRLGECQGDNNQAVSKSLDLKNQLLPEKGAGDPTTDDAVRLLVGLNEGSDKASRPRSGSPFSFPRQKRSVRHRVDPPIDLD